MSVEFYRAEVISQPNSSFAYYNEDLMDFIESKAPDNFAKLDYDGCGLLEIPIVVLQQAIGEVPLDFFNEDAGEKPEYADLGLDDDTIKSIKNDIENAEAQHNSYVTYYAW